MGGPLLGEDVLKLGGVEGESCYVVEVDGRRRLTATVAGSDLLDVVLAPECFNGQVVDEAVLNCLYCVSPAARVEALLVSPTLGACAENHSLLYTPEHLGK